jgi:hypothetical protein
MSRPMTFIHSMACLSSLNFHVVAVVGWNPSGELELDHNVDPVETH